MKHLLSLFALLLAGMIGYWIGTVRQPNSNEPRLTESPEPLTGPGSTPQTQSSAPLSVDGPRSAASISAPPVVESETPAAVPAEPKTVKQLNKEILESALAQYHAAPRRDWALGMPEALLILRSITTILEAQGRGYKESELVGVKDVGAFTRQMGGDIHISLNGVVYPVMRGEFPEYECWLKYQEVRGTEEFSDTNRSASDAVLLPEMETLVLTRVEEALAILSK